MKLLRRRSDARVKAARAAHAAGDFVTARELAAEIVADGDRTLETLRGLAELEYLLGDYEAAEALLLEVIQESERNAAGRVDAEVALALVYLQTNRYADAGGLFAGSGGAVDLPVWELMRSFGDEQPYRLDWDGAPVVTLPFIQTMTWELPCVRLERDGLEVEARIDTGGELLTLSPDVAETVGLHAVAAAEGSSRPARVPRSGTAESTPFASVR